MRNQIYGHQFNYCAHFLQYNFLEHDVCKISTDNKFKQSSTPYKYNIGQNQNSSRPMFLLGIIRKLCAKCQFDQMVQQFFA